MRVKVSLLSIERLPAGKMLPLNQPVQGSVGYGIQTGKQDVTPFDCQQYLKFADKPFGRCT